MKRNAISTAALGVLLILSGPWANAGTLQRGDADNSGSLEITDAILILNFLFSGGREPFCQPVADANGDHELNLSDAVALLQHLFLGNPAPPPLSSEEIAICLGGPVVDPEAIARGIVEYESPDPDGNAFSCTICHSMSTGADSGALRAGYTLRNSLSRPSFKQGGRASFVDAVNVCREEWMQVFDLEAFAFIPWTEDEPRFQDLVAFIDSLSTTDASPALQYDIVAPARGAPTDGDPVAGCELFNRSCSVCHAKDGVGTLTRGPTLLNVTSACQTSSDVCLDLFCESAPDVCLDNPDYLRSRIRLSGPGAPDQPYHLPDGEEFIPSTMPFWSGDKLTDDQVEDLVAFVLESRQAIREGRAPIDCSSMPSDEGTTIRQGTLQGALHGVAGEVEELDSHRLRFTNLSYDGGGIEVRVWIAQNDAPDDGMAIGEDLFGRELDGATLIVELPDGATSDSFDTVSIRCVTTGRDFGAAQLEATP